MSAPEALRLADLLEMGGIWQDQEAAAAELRRLHQFSEDQIGRATAAQAALQMTKTTHALKIAAVEAQRDELLAALRNLLSEGEFNDYPNTTQWYAVQAARAAIEKAEKV